VLLAHERVAVAVFIIDEDFRKATIYVAAGAVFAFFGFIHGAQLHSAASPAIALGYLLLAGSCLAVELRRKPVT